jgi:hypothetical protein
MRVSPLAASFVLLAFPAACAHDPSPAAARTCPSEWTAPPAVAPSLAPRDPSLRVVAHASASGTQDYECASTSADAGGALAWAFVGPSAVLADCSGVQFGRHFASEGGPAAPEWQASDGSFIVAKKIASEPPWEKGAVPWLLLQVTASSGSGALSGVAYVQRTRTVGGAMPQSGCDAAHVGSVAKVPYWADYWFLGR